LIAGSLLLAAVSMAQQGSLASASTKRFSDPAYGVTFHYPAKWSSSNGYKFYSPLSIAPQNEPLRANIFFSSNKGFNPYPQTNLSGAQFAYSVRKASTNEECLKQVLQDNGNAENVGTEDINGVTYSRAQTGSGGMCHQISEDIYAASRNGTCYIFDLAVHTLCAGVVDNTREITGTELSQVHASLEKILSSVEIKDVKKD
jgi:hypothetical protein